MEVFLVCLQQPLKGSGRRLQTSNSYSYLEVRKQCKIQNLETVFSTYWILLVSQLILVFNLRSTSIISIPSSITSHLDQLCRFNGPESRQVEPRAELQQTMKPAELQSDARGFRPPLAVQRPVMPPTSPQGPSSPSGIDNLGQQDAFDRRRPRLWDVWFDEVWSLSKFGSFNFLKLNVNGRLVKLSSFEKLQHPLACLVARHFGTQPLGIIRC